MSLYSDCNISSALLPVITHLLVGHCLHGTSDLYRHLYTAGGQLNFNICHRHSPVHYPPALLLCLPAPPPTHTQPDAICGAMQHTSQTQHGQLHQVIHNEPKGHAQNTGNFDKLRSQYACFCIDLHLVWQIPVSRSQL